MKSLFAVLVTVFFMSTVFGCGDDTDTPAAADVAAGVQEDTTVSDDVGASVEDVAATDDDVVESDTTESTDAGESAPEGEVPQEELPSDPTEDPDQESSFYEFPAWQVPSEG